MKFRWRHGRESLEKLEEGGRGGHDQDTLFIYRKSSKNKKEGAILNDF